MIGILARDAARLLLRGRPALLLVAVGLLVGLFARATRDSGAHTLHGAELKGAALETLAGTLFLVAVVTGLVQGLLLAGEDRRSGFLVLVAVRPVRRLVLVAGRLLGLVLGMAGALLLITLPAVAVAGLDGDDLPEVRRRVRPDRVLVGGQALGETGVAQLAVGHPGRFEFPAGAVPVATLELHPKVPLGASFSGQLDVAIRYEPADGGPALRWRPPPFRPLRELPIHFERPAGTPFALVVEPLAEGFVLEVDRDALTTLGPVVPFPREATLALVMLLAAATIAGALAWFLACELSPGPASLAASFVLLVALGREAVLDIVAGIGADPAHPNLEPGAGTRWLRGFLTVLVRLVPDLARFDPATRLGTGDALPFGEVAGLLAVTALAVIAAAVLGASLLPLRER